MTRGTPAKLDAWLVKGQAEGMGFDQYLCEKHGIFITPSTFIYKDLQDNVLWAEDSERALLNEALKVKRRKAQLHHENSEDAVTWNVFRFLERSGLLARQLTHVRGAPVTDPEAIYWTYCPSEGGVWSQLAKAWDEFGERPQRASEPDVIIRSDETVFMIEAKLGSGSGRRTTWTPKQKAERAGRYGRGERYLRRPVGDIMDAGYFQLMRFWVLGCGIAERLNRDFMLVNLVRSGEEQDIEEAFGSYIRGNRQRRFLRLTWEDTYEFMVDAAPASADLDKIVWYFKNKTISCEKAFSVP
ncbi:MAG TPA: hypothetical protein VM537_05275 [Anaerolineae bacterium]|nr:hypothetical protein [Anaerolineae bacterium]